MAADGGKLRSADWFGREDKGGFIHRSWMKRGLPSTNSTAPGHWHLQHVVRN